MEYKLEKNFANKLLDFLSDEFNNGYNTKTQKNFVSHMESVFDRGFSASWSLGGTSGNCYGEKRELRADLEADLTQLDDFIMSKYPEIKFMQYKMIERSVEKDTKNDSDYYGGESKTAYKSIGFQTLSDVIVKTKMEDGLEKVSVKDLIQSKAAELFPEKIIVKKSEANSEITDFAKSFSEGLNNPKKARKTLGIADEKKIKTPKDSTFADAVKPTKKRM